MADHAEPEILFERRGAAGLVTLNRPRALNALTLEMAQAMTARLDAWAADEAVTRVVVRGAGGRAFCAGGDIRRVYELGRAGAFEDVIAFWHAEYRLNAVVKRFPKPYVALVEGVVMGGGVGLSLHGSHRVSSEGYVFAMPEVGIGFFPDVGATYALPRLPGRAGTYIALTGAKVGPGDALSLGLATNHAAAADFDAVIEALSEGGPVDEALDAHAAPRPPTGPLAAERGIIDDCFSAETVADILGRLDVAASSGSLFAVETAALMRTRSPTSLTIAREQMRRGASASFSEAMLIETRLAIAATRSHDFYEGVRAAIIDKDGRPKWSPATIADVDPAAVAAAFAPKGDTEPVFE